MATGKRYSTDYLVDSNNNTGSTGQVLTSTLTGIDWADGSGSSIIGGPYLPLSAGSGFPLTGDLYLNDSKFLRFVTPSSGNASIDFSTGAALTFTVNSSSAPIIFKQSATEWMRITSYRRRWYWDD